MATELSKTTTRPSNAISRGAAEGNIYAQRQTGDCYYHDHDVTQDRHRAKDWF